MDTKGDTQKTLMPSMNSMHAPKHRANKYGRVRKSPIRFGFTEQNKNQWSICDVIQFHWTFGLIGLSWLDGWLFVWWLEIWVISHKLTYQRNKSGRVKFSFIMLIQMDLWSTDGRYTIQSIFGLECWKLKLCVYWPYVVNDWGVMWFKSGNVSHWIHTKRLYRFQQEKHTSFVLVNA